MTVARKKIFFYFYYFHYLKVFINLCPIVTVNFKIARIEFPYNPLLKSLVK